ncbi:MAG: glycosyltransferase family 2 protein [Candidatus Andersenbacteria bacterium]
MSWLSVVIPTFNSKSSLPAVIAALGSQQLVPGWQYELVISDDGSTDQTLATIPATLPPPWQLTVITHAHTGGAAARNRGIQAARGSVILLLGGDIILRPGAIRAHVDFHASQSTTTAAALGFVQWDPRLRPSPFMEWMTHGGQQNNYDKLLGKRTASPEHFLYGSHVSLKKELLLQYPFSDRFRHYGWEDLDLGRRLVSAKVQLTVLHEARGLHAHYYSVPAILRRQQHVGRGILTYQALHPTSTAVRPLTRGRQIKVVLAQWSGAAVLLKWIVGWTGERWATPRLFAWVTVLSFWQGVYLGRGKQ